MPSRPPLPHRAALRRARRLGFAGLLLFGGTIGVWAATSTLSGAVIASGQLVVSSNVRKVQHPSGGVVSALLVREGDRVQAGDAILRIDETVTRANLGVILRQLDELAVRRVRLEAERDARDAFPAPDGFAARRDEAEFGQLLAGEQTLFEARRQARDGQKAQLRERVGQLREEIRGLRGQQAAREREAALIARELDGVRDLFKRNLVQLPRLSALEREAASLDGLASRLIAQMAQAKGRIAEIELQIIGIDEGLRAEAMRELRDNQARTAELMERRSAAEDQLARVEVKAPASGAVHQLAVHTVGGVIAPGEVISLIVPEQDDLYVETRIRPADVDQVALGQMARVRLQAFNQRATPELSARVVRVAPDVSRDAQTGAPFYVARLALPQGEIERLGSARLLAGMQADVFIATTPRTPIEYLLRPALDQFERAMRER